MIFLITQTSVETVFKNVSTFKFISYSAILKSSFLKIISPQYILITRPHHSSPTHMRAVQPDMILSTRKPIQKVDFHSKINYTPTILLQSCMM